MQTLKTDAEFNCPHCGRGQEGPVQDYVVPGRIGPRSKSNTDCGWCDRYFSVEQVSEGEFVVRKESGSV